MRRKTPSRLWSERHQRSCALSRTRCTPSERSYGAAARRSGERRWPRWLSWFRQHSSISASMEGLVRLTYNGAAAISPHSLAIAVREDDMPSPFPGMDPYLENPKGWQSFHTQFIVMLGQRLVANLTPRYSVSVETRLYIEAWTGNGDQGEFQSLGRAD